MKRMGALTGLTTLAVLSFAYFFGTRFALIGIIAFAVLLVFTVIIRKFRSKHSFQIVFVTGILSLILFTLFTENYYKPIIDNYSYKEINITAKLKENVHKSYEKYYYFLETQSIDGKDDNVNILLKSKNYIRADVDDILDFRAEPQVITNDYYKTKGYFLAINTVDNFKCSVFRNTHKSLRYYLYTFRDTLEKSVNSYMSPDIAGICNAIAFGDRYAVTANVKEAFRKAGISHILVVSGLHMTIVAMIFLFVFSKLLRNRFIYCPLTIAFVILYMIMTGLSFSVVRSGIMVIIMLIGKMVRNTGDSLNSLGIAGLVITVFNPYSAGDIGLMLSFAATLGIITLPDYINDYIYGKIKISNKIARALINIVVISFSAYLFTLPIVIIFLKNVSIYQLLSNILISPVFEILMITILAGALLSLTGITVLFAPFLFIANYLAKYIYLVARLVSKLPFSYVNTEKIYVYIWLLICGVMILSIILMKNYKTAVPIASLFSLLILLCGTVGDYFLNYNKTIFNVYDAGNGISATVSKGGKTVILSCGGDYTHYDITDKLEKSSAEYSLLSVTNAKKSRSRFACDAICEFDLTNLLIYDDSVNEEKLYPVKAAAVYKSKQDSSMNVFTFNSDYTAKIGDIDIHYFVRNGDVFTYVISNNKSLLILPRYGDCSFLEEEYRTPDIVITDSKCKNDNLINTNLLIMSCTEESYITISENCKINAENLYTTYNGDFKSSMEVW